MAPDFCLVLLVLGILCRHGAAAESNVELPRKIAIVGGGIGGSSASYFLREQFGDDVEIDLYEKNARLCGRLATVTVSGREYESGGSIIHPKNLYMKNFVRTLPGLEEANRYSDSTFAIFDGEEYVMRSSVWSVITMLKMICTFGISLFRLQWMERVFMDKFLGIYELQSQGQSFNDVTSLLHAVGGDEFVDATQMTSQDLFSSSKISDFMIHNLVSSGLRTNYGQNASVNGFVGAVSMAGIQSGLWSVKGGNKMVCEKLIANSSVNLVNDAVTAIKFLENSTDGKFAVTTESRPGATAFYDIVIITAPIRQDMDISKACEDAGTCHDVTEDERRYRRTVSNFVKGKLNSSLFKCHSYHDCPMGIFVANQETFYRSIGFHFPVDYDPRTGDEEGVYKVFTTEPLTEKQRSYLFESYTEIATVDWWNAYPSYEPPEKLGTFVLNKAGLFYTSPIEWAASAMEMSVISAKNAALLAYNNWHGFYNGSSYRAPTPGMVKNDL